jgi:ribose/xylose/arabinose/galactoside ABC-type transport system permease subunit
MHIAPREDKRQVRPDLDAGEAPLRTANVKAPRSLRFCQEQTAFAIAVQLFAIFSVTLHGFLETDNLLSTLQNVSIPGILGFGMAFAVIGRGIDLSIVTTMVMSVAWMFTLANQGVPVTVALLAGLAFAALIGLIEGVLIAYVEIPAIFTTLAMSSVVYGFRRIALVNGDIVYLPKGASTMQYIGNGFFWRSDARGFTGRLRRARSFLSAIYQARPLHPRHGGNGSRTEGLWLKR